MPEQDISSLMDGVCSDLVAPYVRQKEHIFIDVETLYDFKLGALFCLTTKDQYKYILDLLPDYLSSKDLEVCKHFPECNVDEETINRFMDDPVVNKTLSLIAPPRSLVEDLADIIPALNTYNTSKETQHPLKITINQSTFELSDEAKLRLEDYIHSVDSNVEVTFVKYNWTNIPKDVLEMQDVIIVYDIAAFVDISATPVIDCIKEGVFAKTTIASFMQVTNQNCEDTAKGEMNFAITMDIFCNNFIILEKELLIRK